nr:Phosphatidylinositol:ceramide inositolphosphotransferase [Ipomoea batatas]GMC85785.1 Phosphatidylinositol:ceramide inositolphosphotransferase [Ipomoea batatas]GMC90074.1 Phosphatidylinositol:ceramide inositolphosphotransferase [Ipomoea batatas]
MSQFSSTSMDWLLEGFITYIGQDRLYRMLGSFFFRNLVKTRLTSVRQYSLPSLCLLSCGLSIRSF